VRYDVWARQQQKAGESEHRLPPEDVQVVSHHVVPPAAHRHVTRSAVAFDDDPLVLGVNHCLSSTDLSPHWRQGVAPPGLLVPYLDERLSAAATHDHRVDQQPTAWERSPDSKPSKETFGRGQALLDDLGKDADRTLGCPCSRGAVQGRAFNPHAWRMTTGLDIRIEAPRPVHEDAGLRPHLPGGGHGHPDDSRKGSFAISEPQRRVVAREAALAPV
jgi:hypothetical protein